jgi:hypothetical protein
MLMNECSPLKLMINNHHHYHHYYHNNNDQNNDNNNNSIHEFNNISRQSYLFNSNKKKNLKQLKF